MSPRSALAIAAVTAVVAVAAAVTLFSGEPGPPDAAAAKREALRWTGARVAEEPRRKGDSWEVDVHRADGSLVEVTLGPKLELRELDEERGAGGVPAHDEVTGRLRQRAIAAARPRGGGGAVRGVERELDGAIEVDFTAPGGTVIEVELDGELRITDTDRETVADE